MGFNQLHHQGQASLVSLFQGICHVTVDVVVTGLCDDSRLVKPGDLFFARVGGSFDARGYIAEAVDRGAVAICQSGEQPAVGFWRSTAGQSIPLITVKDVAGVLPVIAATYFGDPSRAMYSVAVTGTNGKSSIAWWLSHVWQWQGRQAGMVGTLGKGPVGALQSNTHTTPGIIALQQTLAEMAAQNVDHVVMEASSHALVQKRLQGLRWQTAIFLPVTPEHLDYHGDMSSYRAAKRRLLTDFQVQSAIAVSDDEAMFETLVPLAEQRQIPLWALAFRQPLPCDWQGPYVCVHHLAACAQGFEVTLSHHQQSAAFTVYLPFLASFQVMNALLVWMILACEAEQHRQPWPALDTLTHWPPVPGRMQWSRLSRDRHVVIDYAHTPDAMEQVLAALRDRCQGNLHVIFGCGGDRDSSKRGPMGATADRYADRITLTNDNPRHEDPMAIVASIRAAIPRDSATVVDIELDRRLAIERGLMTLQRHDWLVILGKGHESIQIQGEREIKHCDTRVVEAWLSTQGDAPDPGFQKTGSKIRQ